MFTRAIWKWLKLRLASSYCDEPVIVVAGLFTHDKAARRFNIPKKQKNLPSKTEDARSGRDSLKFQMWFCWVSDGSSGVLPAPLGCYGVQISGHGGEIITDGSGGDACCTFLYTIFSAPDCRKWCLKVCADEKSCHCHQFFLIFDCRCHRVNFQHHRWFLPWWRHNFVISGQRNIKNYGKFEFAITKYSKNSIIRHSINRLLD